MTKVTVEERHHTSTRDVEGYLYDEREMDDDSKEFMDYLEEFHVMEKYRKGIVSYTSSIITNDDKPQVNGKAYFNGWVPQDPRTVMCYIVIYSSILS
ncbi:MAG: hypothetical protein QXU18_12290 [Thermoplasmatales archaeon]